jgi:hypothetical protein
MTEGRSCEVPLNPGERDETALRCSLRRRVAPQGLAEGMNSAPAATSPPPGQAFAELDHDRHHHDLGPPAHELEISGEGDVVGPFFSGLHGQVTGVAAGDAQNGVGAEAGPGGAIGREIGQMHAVGPEPGRELDIAGDDDRRAALLGQADQIPGVSRGRQAEASDLDCIEDGGEGDAETGGKDSRRCQIELAARRLGHGSKDL